jgi:hypothetical protein
MMPKASYLKEEIWEITEAKRIADSRPKFPTGKSLDKSLPKALRLLSVGFDKYTLSDIHPCDIVLKNLLIPAFEKNKNQEELFRHSKALHFLDKNKFHKMLTQYSKSMIKVLDMSLFWIRDIEDWKCKSYNTHKQITSLISHLFCKYEVPEFMFQAWESTSHAHIEWFLQLSEGVNARNLHKLPLVFTKKMAHEFITTPFPGYTIDDALRRCQIIGLGGDERLTNAVLMSRLRHNFNNNDFWVTVFQTFINTTMLNLDEVGTVIDYINEIKYVHQHFMINGRRVYQPEIPGFSMKGRNIETLIRDTHNWHKALSKNRKIDMSSKWTNSGIPTFVHEEGDIHHKNYKVYELLELCTAKELHTEGKTMHNCVYSYVSSCVNKKCLIFSLRLFGQSLVTIEVRNNIAVQIRGNYNSRPGNKEINLISTWARKNNIEIAKYAIRSN